MSGENDIINERQFFGEHNRNNPKTNSFLRHKRLGFDLDGVFFEDVKDVDIYFRDNIPMVAIPGGKQITAWLKTQGYDIIICTCRPDYHHRYVLEQLEREGIKFDNILYYSKPRVDLYIDDKGYRFSGFEKLREDIESLISGKQIQ